MNEVSLTGKLNRVGRLTYAPSGQAILELNLSVPQKVLGKQSMGSFEILCFGDDAENAAQVFRIGGAWKIDGLLWTRRYRNRKGEMIRETKVIAQKFVKVTSFYRERAFEAKK